MTRHLKRTREGNDESCAAFSEGELDAMVLLSNQQQQDLRLSWPSEETRQQMANRMEAARAIKYGG